MEKRKERKRDHEILQQELDCSQNVCLEPKHKIFLSHSGAQKNFTAQLCEDLIGVSHFPFFDKRLDSLPKGEEFPPLLLKAARQCRLAILVLSEDFFTRSKWPMLELSEFVQAQAVDNRSLKLLPLYFGLKLNELKDAGNQKRWRETWERWAEGDGRIDVGKWVHALSRVLGPVNGMEYDGVDEVAFRKNVVAAVCKSIPPDVKYDVSHVQALPRLCKAVSEKMDEIHGRDGCRVLGLFGTAGMGKTTLSKVLCSENFGEFGGRVCHVEFSGNNYVELRKKVLRELTGASQEHLPNEADKLLDMLKSRMHHQRVFSIFDNVLSEDDIDEVKMYLDIEYVQDSKVLVTSRSLDVLKSLGLRECDCMGTPELEEHDATSALLYYAGSNHKDFNESQLDIIKRCVEVCKFTKTDIGGSECGSSAYHYLPLALKVWGTQLGHVSKDPMSWVESLKTLNEHKFNRFEEQVHPLFSLLRQGYDKLGVKEQHIFLDLVIFFPRRAPFDCTDYSIVEWLSIIHGCSEGRIGRSLNALKRKALLEDSVKDGSAIKIHDLYLEFARVEAQAGPFDRRRVLLEWNGADIPREFLKKPVGGFWHSLERLGLCKSEVESLKKERLDRCCNVELLQLYDCHKLVEVDVGGMENLLVLDIVGCQRLGGKLRGVEKLENLAWLRLRDIDEGLAPFLLDLSCLSALQVLHLSCVLWEHKSTVPPDLSGCINLLELTMDGFHNLESLPNLSNLSKLEKISFRYATEAISVFGLNWLTKLKVLDLYWCPKVTELPGLCDLIALETLNFTDVGLSEIIGLEKLGHLRNLTVSSCRNLTSLVGLEYLTSLRRLDASESKKLQSLPDCSNLKELEVVNLSRSGICILPSDFERLAKHRILNIEGCVGLFEPLVVWLLNQQRAIALDSLMDHLELPEESSEGLTDCRKEYLYDLKKRMWNSIQAEEYSWSNIREAFPETNCFWGNMSGVFVEANHTWSKIREVFAHYMEEVVLLRPNNSHLTLVNPKFCENEILPGACMLEDYIGSVMTLLCNHDDMGILSLVVAKYAKYAASEQKPRSSKWLSWLSGDYLPGKMDSDRIQRVCQSILRFLEVLYHQLEANTKAMGREKDHLISCVQFILQHVTMSDEMALEFTNLNMLEFIQRCPNSWGLDYIRRWYFQTVSARIENSLRVQAVGEQVCNPLKKSLEWSSGVLTLPDPMEVTWL
ncbi:hypothetical protein KC19_2G252200 [Ceratodon purpureus]|uniref:TIR domain-containing protein n=1 Tax=Ceratodon purpureus TaxID=3225 RepID=A0A8T0IXT5_CERPU|nr:hypothetical protein KC19_2G252200 [Ceratodon purpureus]